MTVKELIQKLQELPEHLQEAPVVANDLGTGYFNTITTIISTVVPNPPNTTIVVLNAAEASEYNVFPDY